MPWAKPVKSGERILERISDTPEGGCWGFAFHRLGRRWTAANLNTQVQKRLARLCFVHSKQHKHFPGVNSVSHGNGRQKEEK